MKHRPIYTLPIENAELLSANPGPLIDLLTPIAANPGAAKDRRGSLVLDLSKFDSDPRPNWQIPEIRAHVRELTAACQPSLISW
jgi:hypothetical protein